MKASQIMCTSKIFIDLCYTKQRIKIKSTFSCKNVLTEHKEVCWSNNWAQSVRSEKGITEFKNYLKQIPVPFKFYADFECNLNNVKSYEGSYSIKVSGSHSL